MAYDSPVPSAWLAWTTTVALSVVASVILSVLLVPSLPEPVNAAGKTPYRQLVTPPFTVLAAGCASAAMLLVCALVSPWLWLAWSAVAVIGSLLAIIDLQTTFVPRRLTRLGFAWAGLGCLVGTIGLGHAVALRAVGGAALAFGVYWVLWRFGRGLGYGDVRLAPLVGAVSATPALATAFAALLAGSIIGVIWGVVLLVRRRQSTPFPLAPAMVLGSYASLAWTLVS